MNIALDLRTIIDIDKILQDSLLELIGDAYRACSCTDNKLLIILDDADPSQMISIERKMESVVPVESIIVSSTLQGCSNVLVSNILFEETLISSAIDFLIILNPRNSFKFCFIPPENVGIIWYNINNTNCVSVSFEKAFSYFLKKDSYGCFTIYDNSNSFELTNIDDFSSVFKAFAITGHLLKHAKKTVLSKMIKIIHNTLRNSEDQKFILQISQCFSENKRIIRKEKFLYIDVSGIINSDNGSGIPRFVNNMVKNLLSFHCDYTIYPIVSDNRLLGYSYATEFMKSRFPFLLRKDLNDGIIFSPKDAVLFLDPVYNIEFQYKYHQKLMSHGVRIFQILHDLVPIRFAETTADGIPEFFKIYCRDITNYDGIIANSRSTAKDFIKWIVEDNYNVALNRPLLSWFHMGSDLSGNCHLVSTNCSLTKSLGNRFTFLMVSTIEPRKNYQQALDAFDQLWYLGRDYNLVIVGQEGWKSGDIINRIQKHPLKNKNLFWYFGISDDELSSLYNRADVVLMTSLGEGFGLALIEAAHYGKPLIVRDIPIFREIADGHAFFFKGVSGTQLATQIEEWMKTYKNGTYCKSQGMECLSWQESAHRLLTIVLSMLTKQKDDSVELMDYTI